MSSPGAAPRVRRFDHNPIVRPEMLPGADGDNINGPSLIRAPEWIRPRAAYYLYFAHHAGAYIRLALADELDGPWTVHPPGTLRLDQVRRARGHVASPDVHVDPDRGEVRMYFHAPVRWARGAQRTFVATSRDGIKFTPLRRPLGSFYFRAFRWDGWWYAIAKGGALFRSRDGLSRFEPGHNPFLDPGGGRDENARFHNRPGPIRHVAVQVRGDALRVYYTRIGDAPERILRDTVPLTDEWREWRATGSEAEVLRPEMEYEGAGLPIAPSRAGAAERPENAVRDPALFAEHGDTYLLYSVAGERGLAIAALEEDGS